MNPPESRSRILLLAVFFVSGISALFYQVVWLKYLGFTFGNTVYAAATLIAIFLAGLGVGGWIFSRVLAKAHPLLVYAILEAAIGAFGSTSQAGFSLLDRAYIASFRMFEHAPFELALARASFAALFLIVPTILMGGTLPVLVRWVTGGRPTGGRSVSSLYAANTFGATAGVAVSGFYTIPQFGLTATIAFAVTLNFVLAGAAALMAWSTREKSAAEVEPGRAAPDYDRGGAAPFILLASLFMGLTSIADEVFWSRVLVLHLGSSVYAYALMLFSFLIGLAVGSAVIDRFIARVDAVRVLLALEAALAVALALQVFYFGRFPDVLETIARFVGLTSYAATMMVFVAAVLSALLIPTALMGATFPLTVRLYAERARIAESRAVGSVYLANTIGSISGSLLAGFVLIRILGSQNGLFAMALINLVIAGGFWFASSRSRRDLVAIVVAALVLGGAFATARKDQVILAAGMFADSKARIVVFREDVTATVTLRQMSKDALWLELNGVNVAGTSPDLIGTQKLQGHLPLLMHPNPKKILHIGFGSGGTAYAVSQHPVSEIRIAEISPEVLDVSGRYLKSVNHGVLADRRVRAEINDGRNFVLATPEKFDVILSDSIHPRYAGNGSLYTKDYFELCKKKLNPGGVVSMWLPDYSLTTKNYLMIVRAFRDVFPNTTIWYVPNTPNAFTIVIGRTEAGPIPLGRLASRMNPAVRRELAGIGIRDEYDLAGALMLDPQAVEQLTANVEPHVDDVPAVEYESGRLLDADIWWLRTFSLLVRASSPLPRAFTDVGDPAALAEAGRIRDARDRFHAEWLYRTLLDAAKTGTRR